MFKKLVSEVGAVAKNVNNVNVNLERKFYNIIFIYLFVFTFLFSDTNFVMKKFYFFICLFISCPTIKFS